MLPLLYCGAPYFDREGGYKKVLLLKSKRHTASCAASTRCAALSFGGGYLPWTGGTYPGGGGYLPWTGEVPTLLERYPPWMEGVPTLAKEVPTLDGGCLPWPGRVPTLIGPGLGTLPVSWKVGTRPPPPQSWCTKWKYYFRSYFVHGR